MKFISSKSITVKLFFVNSLIFLVIGGIIFVVNGSFQRIEHSLTQTIQQDIHQVIRNAQVGRELNRIFTEMNALVRTLYEQNEGATGRYDKLNGKIKTIAQQESNPQFQDLLQQLQQKLRWIFEQGETARQSLQLFYQMDDEMKTTINALEDTLEDKRRMKSLDGEKQEIDFAHLNNFIPGFRETLLLLTVQIAKLQSEHAGQAHIHDTPIPPPVQEQHPHLFALLRDFNEKLDAFPTSDADIAEPVAQLRTFLGKYNATAAAFHEILQAVDVELVSINDLQEQMLKIMRESDERVGQTADTIRAHITKTIGDSTGIITILTLIILLVLSLGWVITHIMTRPLVELSAAAAQLADGDLACHIRRLNSRDEIGKLSNAFIQLLTYFQSMAQIATEISHGHLDLDVHPRSKHDIFGNRFQQMIAYLKEIGKTAASVAQGDLRQHVALRSDQDQLGKTFLEMQDGLIALILEIRAGADYISSMSTQVLGTSSKNIDALGHIGNAAEVTSAAMREMSSSADEVRISTERLRSSVDTTSTSIHEMNLSVKHIAENSRKLSNFAQNTAQTISTIVNSLQTVAGQAEHSQTLAETTTRDALSGQQAIEQMREKMTAISQVTQNLSTIIRQLEKRSSEIGTILDVINEVADQTSLLALNASIIAAQAGTHGRGFAVVADQIKELANRVGTSTKEIAKIVAGVQRDSSEAANAIARGQQEVERGVVATREASAVLDEIAASAGNSSHVAAEIAVLVREQTVASTHMADSMKDVANMVTEITHATQEQERNSSQLLGTVENMQDLAKQVLRAMEEQQHSSQHVTQFMEDVLKLVEQNIPTVKQLAATADALTVQADKLTHHVERFTLPERSPQTRA